MPATSSTPPTPTRERMLDATAALLHRHGFHGASLNRILAESGAPRGSLYHHFPGGKEQLVLEATRRGVEQVTRALEEIMTTGDPVASVRAFITAAAEELRLSGYVFGCPIAPIVLDLSGKPSPLAEVCREAVADWQRILREGLAAAGVATDRAASLAVTVVAAVEGALILARAERDTAPLDNIAQELAALIESALP